MLIRAELTNPLAYTRVNLAQRRAKISHCSPRTTYIKTTSYVQTRGNWNS